ncbi:MAG: hypothetical protein K5685_06640 [Bacteroidales bacterium]|nr:hypothetical protein [Bacteroidales bacterium]
MFNLHDYIAQEMRSRGITKYKVVPEYVNIYGSNTIIDLTKNIYLFVSQDIDVQIPVKVELISFDNSFVFTKTVLQTSVMSQFQFFSQQLEIKVSQIDNQTQDAREMKNYVGNSAEFIPFRLEFIRIIPLFED